MERGSTTCSRGLDRCFLVVYEPATEQFQRQHDADQLGVIGFASQMLTNHLPDEVCGQPFPIERTIGQEYILQQRLQWASEPGVEVAVFSSRKERRQSELRRHHIQASLRRHGQPGYGVGN